MCKPFALSPGWPSFPPDQRATDLEDYYLLSSLKLLVIMKRQQTYLNVLLWTLTGALHLSFECPDSTGDFLQSERALHVGLLW